MGASWIVVWELQTGVIERLRVTPTGRFSLLMGSVLKDVVMLVVPGLLVLLVASLFGFQIHWAGLAVLFVPLSLLIAVVSAASGSLGLILKNIGSLAAVVASRDLAADTLGSSGVWQAFAVMVPLTALTLWWATRVYRKAVA